MLGPDGKPITSRGWFDTEALALDGSLVYVGLERVNQILKFDFAKGGTRSRGEAIAVPPPMRKLPYNKGLESLVLVPKGLPLAGSLIAISERGLDIGKAGHLATLVDDAAGEPGPLVAHRNELLAFGVEPPSRQPAKTAEPRGQDQPAAILQRAEACARAVASIERRDRPGIDLDRHGSRDREFIRRRLFWPRLRVCCGWDECRCGGGKEAAAGKQFTLRSRPGVTVHVSTNAIFAAGSARPERHAFR